MLVESEQIGVRLVSRRVKFALALILLPGALAAAPLSQFLESARQQIGVTLHYDSAYSVIAYPGGDVPVERGVCTDVIIRAMRGVGIDLQREVHEDMMRAFKA